MALQPDGKIVVTGYSGQIAVTARYTAAGALDLAYAMDNGETTYRKGHFGVPGYALLFVEATSRDVGRALALQPDGKVVIAGHSHSSRSPRGSKTENVLLARYTAGGLPDITFDGDGLVVSHPPGGAAYSVHSLTLQSDGKIVVAGESDGKFFLARYHGDGGDADDSGQTSPPDSDPNSDGANTGPGLELSATGLNLVVNASASYTLRLREPPIDTVLITPTVADPDTAGVSPAQLYFDYTNWHLPQTVTITGLSAGATSVRHSIQSPGPDYQGIPPATVAVTVAAASSPQVANKYAALIANMYQWRNDPLRSGYAPHVERWDRALLALGETVADDTLTAMPASEAQTYADRGWTRWVEVTQALTEIEAAAQQQQQPANNAPTVSSAIADATIVNASGTKRVSLSSVFNDADNESLTISAGTSNSAVAAVSVSADHSALTVTARSRGTATITVTASDGNGGTVADTFTVTVKAAPTVASAIGDISGMELFGTSEVSLSGVFTDADGDSLTITAESSDDDVASAVVGQDNELTIFALEAGSVTVTVTAEDADGNTVSDVFSVSVGSPQPQPQPVNNAPTVSSAIADAVIVNESGTRRISLSGVFTDADNDSLTISAGTSNSAVAAVSVSADYAALTLTARSRGTATITVTAADGNGGTVSDSFSLRVKAAPVVASALADVSGLTAGTSREVWLSSVFRDADGDGLTISAASSNRGVASVSVAGGGSRLRLTGAAEGAAAITVTARDADGNTVSDVFSVSVAARPATQPTPEPESEDIVARYDTNGDGRISTSELAAALSDFKRALITYAQVLELIAAR